MAGKIIYVAGRDGCGTNVVACKNCSNRKVYDQQLLSHYTVEQTGNENKDNHQPKHSLLINSPPHSQPITGEISKGMNHCFIPFLGGGTGERRSNFSQQDKLFSNFRLCRSFFFCLFVFFFFFLVFACRNSIDLLNNPLLKNIAIIWTIPKQDCHGLRKCVTETFHCFSRDPSGLSTWS